MSAVGGPGDSGRDLETSGHDLEKSAADLEKSGTDPEKSRTDLEKSRNDLEKSRSTVERSRSTLERSSNDLEGCRNCPGWQTRHLGDAASGQAPRELLSGPKTTQRPLEATQRSLGTT